MSAVIKMRKFLLVKKERKKGEKIRTRCFIVQINQVYGETTHSLLRAVSAHSLLGCGQSGLQHGRVSVLPRGSEIAFSAGLARGPTSRA